MPAKIEQLRPHSPGGEKRGNTSWTQCPTCDGWLHTTTDLLNRGSIALHCPHCAGNFLPKDAKRIVMA